MIDWTCVGGKKVPDDEREAIVTRRILAGHLPICCLVEDESIKSGWRAVAVANLVPEEYRSEFVAFARSLAVIVGKEFKDALSGAETSVRLVPWEARSYPGLPVKGRPAGTIRIEVDVQRRTITTVSSMLGAKEFPIRDKHITGNDAEDALYIARHVIKAMERFDPPWQLVEGDQVEVWQTMQDGESKLLATVEFSVTLQPAQNESGIAENSHAN